VTIGPEPFDADGARFVVARAEAELAERYGGVGGRPMHPGSIRFSKELR
jgi:hypothetical protein